MQYVFIFCRILQSFTDTYRTWRKVEIFIFQVFIMFFASLDRNKLYCLYFLDYFIWIVYGLASWVLYWAKSF